MAARRCFDARRSMLTRNFWRPRSRATAGTGATIPLLEYYDGGDTFVPPPAFRPPGHDVRARRRRRQAQAAGPSS